MNSSRRKYIWYKLTSLYPFAGLTQGQGHARGPDLQTEVQGGVIQDRILAADPGVAVGVALTPEVTVKAQEEPTARAEAAVEVAAKAGPENDPRANPHHHSDQIMHTVLGV